MVNEPAIRPYDITMAEVTGDGVNAKVVPAPYGRKVHFVAEINVDDTNTPQAQLFIVDNTTTPTVAVPLADAITTTTTATLYGMQRLSSMSDRAVESTLYGYGLVVIIGAGAAKIANTKKRRVYFIMERLYGTG